LGYGKLPESSDIPIPKFGIAHEIVNTKHFAKNYTSTLRKEGSPLLLERACPENWEVGGEVEITKHHKMKT